MTEPRLKVMEAITRKQAVSARYNGDTIKLAPHMVFERHGDLFVSALNMSKEWRSADEMRLGQFKLAGLSAAELLPEPFVTLSCYDRTPPREGDVLIFSV